MNAGMARSIELSVGAVVAKLFQEKRVIVAVVLYATPNTLVVVESIVRAGIRVELPVWLKNLNDPPAPEVNIDFRIANDLESW